MSKLIEIILIFFIILFSAEASPAERQLGSVNMTFSATVKSYSCKIESIPPVSLRDWSVRSFQHTGARTSPVYFTFNMQGCPPEETISVSFSGEKMSQDGLIALDNTSTAKGVAVEIRDSGEKKVTPGAKYNANTDVRGVTTLTFSARYVSTSSMVTAGTADASVEYTVTYQ